MMRFIIIIIINLFFTCSFCFAQGDLPPNEPGKCYAKCTIFEKLDDDEIHSTTYPVYIGNDHDNVKLKTVKHTFSLAQTEWVKKPSDRNCLSKNPEDCFIWCLVESIPEEYIYLTVVKRPKKVPDSDIDYQTYETFTSKDDILSNHSEWRETLCDKKINANLIQQIQNRLNFFGYDSGPKLSIFGQLIKSTLIKFQNDNNLPVGHLDFESLDALGVSY